MWWIISIKLYYYSTAHKNDVGEQINLNWVYNKNQNKKHTKVSVHVKARVNRTCMGENNYDNINIFLLLSLCFPIVFQGAI